MAALVGKSSLYQFLSGYLLQNPKGTALEGPGTSSRARLGELCSKLLRAVPEKAFAL